MTSPRIVVVGLGPASPELVTAGTRAALDRIAHRYLRTARHPAVEVATWTATFDDIYDSTASLTDVYQRIVAELMVAAERHAEVLYAVPGSPLVAERTVVLLAEAAEAGCVNLKVLPALSFCDLAWARLGVDPVAAGVRMIDGHRFAVEAAGERGPLLVAQCDSQAVLSEVKLAFDEPPPSATVLARLGLPTESICTVAWADLDRVVEPDHLTSLWLPTIATPIASELVRLDELVRALRQGCPWDREQTHRSLTRHLLEETYEVLEAIEALGDGGGNGDGKGGGVSLDPAAGYVHLEEELGDLLFQIVFHARLAAEAGQFTLGEVARGIHDKLVHRHPHVFGDVQVASAGEVLTNWEHIKQREKGRASVMDGISSGLPSLLYAHKALRKAAALGLEYERAALPSHDPGADVGDALLALVDQARRTGVDPEAALRAATARFIARAQAAEAITPFTTRTTTDAG